mgnify:CR=1 FL=1
MEHASFTAAKIRYSGVKPFVAPGRNRVQTAVLLDQLNLVTVSYDKHHHIANLVLMYYSSCCQYMRTVIVCGRASLLGK